MARITAPACLVRKAAIALVVVVLMLSPAVEAYIYHLPNRELGVVDSTGESTYQYLSEGPMFSRDDAPFGDGLSYIDISGTAALDASGAVLGSAVLNVIFFSEYNEETVGYYSGLNGGNTLQNRELCCTRQHVLRGVCNHAGRVIVQGLNTNFTVPGFSGPLPLLHAYFVHGGEVTFHDKYVVQRSGSQSAMLVVCDSDFTLTAKVTANIVAEFHNPYGYVRGIQYGYLPGYGALTCAYAIVFFGYCLLCLCHRDKLIPLQFGVACVMLMGMVEVATWFITYISKNDSGVPVCDTDGSCPPLSSDVMAAAVLSVGKSTVSRALLLVVCLGYGVVKPRLPRKQTVWVIVLSVLYFVFGTVAAMVRAHNPEEVQASFWEMPVVVFDMIFVCWIYTALENIRKQLRQDRQPAKLKMYNQLTTTLTTFVVIWLLVSVVIAAVVFGIVPLAWKAAWALGNFWDVVYLLLLLSIAYIWAPGARTQMYSLYSQPTHFEEGDGAGIGSGDVELAGVPAGAFRINDSESDSDGDADLARPYSDADAEPTANANEGAHGEPLSTGTGAAVASTQDNEDTPVAGDASSAAADQPHDMQEEAAAVPADDATPTADFNTGGAAVLTNPAQFTDEVDAQDGDGSIVAPTDVGLTDQSQL